MRLVALSLSAVLLSGCSWFGGNSNSQQSYHDQRGAYAGSQNQCVVYSPAQPVPTGCDPAMVTMATGYGQAGAGGAYTTGGYGSHVSNAGNVSSQRSGQPRLKKPKLRGSMSFGTEKSVAGTLLDFSGALAPGFAYDPTPFQEGSVEQNGDIVTSTLYTSQFERYVAPSLSFDDVYNTPTILKGGFEYIASPRFTVFANAGYSHAEGTDDARITVQSTLLKTTTTDDITDALPPLSNTEFIPNVNVAHMILDFNDQRRFDVEAGARHYFKPIMQEKGYRTVTPFVAGAVGISHVNDVTYTTEQDQLFLAQAFDSSGANTNFYDVLGNGGVNTLYESDWLLNGAVTAGMEWQVTPKWALALETGVKFEQARDFANGDEGDNNVSVPVTLRGSFNF